MQHHFYGKFAIVIHSVFLSITPVHAQVVPDSSLGESRSIVVPSQLIRSNPSDLITGGANRGSALFHSFDQFNVSAGKGVYFTSPAGITNILSRVTGKTPSNILGKLGVLGNANLFFLNPNGIFFGPNSSLDLNGSFLATTASSFELSNNTQFSTNDPQSPPLLTVSVPIGVSFSGNEGSIQVQGTGHTLSNVGNFPTSRITGAGASETGLRIQPGNTIALVGGNVSLKGGGISAPSGQIAIGSVGSGQVTIEQNLYGFALDFANSRSFQDIQLIKLSLLDASGDGGGEIRLQGQQILFSDGSFAFIENQGLNPSGKITVKATELLQAIGTTSNPVPKSSLTAAETRSGLITYTFEGEGPSIFVTTKDLMLDSGGGITPITFSTGKAGTVSIDASGSVKVAGFSPLDPINSYSIISSASLGSGDAGSVSISANSLLIQEGAGIASSALATGSAGDLIVNADKSVFLEGFNPITLLPSALGTAAFGPGDAGSIIINSEELTLANGAGTNSSTYFSGNAGNLQINAERIVVQGNGFVSPLPSQISSSAEALDPVLQDLLGLPPLPSGDAGDVSITAEKLLVTDGGEIAVRNDGTGRAGTLRINANSIDLDNQGDITASTAQGNGGNVQLQINDLLLLQNNSNITASAGRTGSGGNIALDTNLLAALQNSSIIANAEQSTGGQVTINTQGLFLSPSSTIAATSELGSQFDGVVEINTPDVDLSRAAAEPTATPESPEVSSTCQGSSAASESSLVNAGTGGTPSSFINSLSQSAGWQEPSPSPQNPQATPNNPQSGGHSPTELPEQFVQATGWIRNSDGTVDFIADASKGSPYSSQATLACSQTNISDNAR